MSSAATLLEPILRKLNQLVNSMNEFLSIHPHAAWNQVLSQFNTLIAKYVALLREMQAPALRQLIVHPNTLLEEDPEMIPRVLLRTKLLPEIEELEQVLLSKVRDSDQVINELDESMVKEAMRSWEVIFDRYEDVSNHCISTFDLLRQEYNLKKRVDLDSQPSDEEAMQVDRTLPGVKGLIIIPRDHARAELEALYKFMYSGD